MRVTASAGSGTNPRFGSLERNRYSNPPCVAHRRLIANGNAKPHGESLALTLAWRITSQSSGGERPRHEPPGSRFVVPMAIGRVPLGGISSTTTGAPPHHRRFTSESASGNRAPSVPSSCATRPSCKTVHNTANPSPYPQEATESATGERSIEVAASLDHAIADAPRFVV